MSTSFRSGRWLPSKKLPFRIDVVDRHCFGGHRQMTPSCTLLYTDSFIWVPQRVQIIPLANSPLLRIHARQSSSLLVAVTNSRKKWSQRHNIVILTEIRTAGGELAQERWNEVIGIICRSCKFKQMLYYSYYSWPDGKTLRDFWYISIHFKIYKYRI